MSYFRAGLKFKEESSLGISRIAIWRRRTLETYAGTADQTIGRGIDNPSLNRNRRCCRLYRLICCEVMDQNCGYDRANNSGNPCAELFHKPSSPDICAGTSAFWAYFYKEC